MSQAITHADRLVARGEVLAAVRLLDQAGQAGDALAARELAVWYLQGQPVPRDLAQARKGFARAAALGDGPSKAVIRNFLAQGIGGPAEWNEALAMLRSAAAAGDADSERQLRVLAGMSLDGSGNSEAQVTAEVVSNSPAIRVFRNFLTAEECDYLAGAALPFLQPAVIVDPATGRQRPNPIRTSEAAAFPFVDETPVIHAINRRIGKASETDVRCGEPLQVLRYAPGQEYRLHNDALPGCPPAQQRVLTFLIWLNDDYAGGETDFPRLGVRVRGRKGDGVLFASTTADGAPDPRAIHAGLPVTSGTKMLASRWIRATPLIF